ncbi:MAG: peptide chain release factor N(5)-glutamine methyltransferase [Myxococcales bacterium]|nr:peptide chain release factor N(5)-glutamine methyltransferase [Myxococcales bacterium]
MLAWMAGDFASKGLPDARLDAELIVAHVLGIDRLRLYMDMDRPLQQEELDGIRELVRRRRTFEPVAYLRGIKEFFGRDFVVNHAVLIPRPETELLVERALALLNAEKPSEMLDLCTGSGAIAVTLAAERAALQVTATDISVQALGVAQENAARLGVSERVRFVEGDLFSAVPVKPFTLLTANPPYIAEEKWDELSPDVALHEPRLALAGGGDGLAIAGRIIVGAGPYLAPKGLLLMEMGQHQSEELVRLANQQSWVERAHVHPDLRGIPRLLELERIATLDTRGVAL